MAKTTFILKEPQLKEQKEKQPLKDTLIFLVFRYGNNRIKFSTKEKINPKYWNEETLRARKTKQFSGYSNFNHKLKTIEDTAMDLFRAYENNNDHKQPTVAEMRELLQQRFNPATSENDKTLFGFIDRFIDEAKTRVNDKTGKPFSTGIRQGYNQTLKVLKDFQLKKRKRIDFDTIDLNFYNEFTEYMATEKKYAINNIGKHIKTLKTFLNDATERGYNTNFAFKMKKFKTFNVPVENIYLNESELDELLKLDLTNEPNYERVRDLFLVGCWTGLRFSDWSNIKPDNIDGDLIDITTQKQGDTVAIPIHSTIKKIMRKYKGQNENSLPPAISSQKTNDYLKEIGKKIDTLKIPVSNSYTKGGKFVTTTKPKHDLITTHTARRSFASNLYIKGFPAQQIMKITGHKTESAFMKYIKITPRENAKVLQLFWHNENKLQVV